MSLVSSPSRQAETVADLLHRLGDIDPARIRLRPPPGTATVEDLIQIHDHEDRLYELVEGVLVEKAMGFGESEIAMLLGHHLLSFVLQHRLGIVAGADGTVQIAPGLVRVPDLAFFAWTSLPGGQRPRRPIPAIAPDLAVEVLSKSNTKGEMARKLREYFETGTRLVWLIEPKTQTVRVHDAPDHSVLVNLDGVLEGGEVLPGFALPVREIFPEVQD